MAPSPAAAARLRRQCTFLLWKHALLASRRWRATAVQLLAPLLVAVLLHGVQRMADAVLSRDDARPPATQLPRLPRCAARECVTVLYGPAGVPWVETLMREVARRNGLSYERDFEALPRQPRLVGDGDVDVGDEGGEDGGGGSGGGGSAGPSSSTSATSSSSSSPSTSPSSSPSSSSSSSPSSSLSSPWVPASAAEAASKAADRFEICLCEDAFCSSYTADGRVTAAYCLLAQDPLCRPCAYVRDARAADRVVLSRPGRVQNALLFTTAYVPVQPSFDTVAGAGDFDANTTVGYILMFNATVGQYPTYGENHATALKLAVDEAALALAMGRPKTQLAASQRGFPTPPSRLAGVDMAGGQAGTFFYVPPMVAFFHTLTELVDEKERRVRLGMHVMGLTAGAFWSAECVKSVVVAAAVAVSQVAAGAAFGFDVFDAATPLATVPLFFLFTLAMCAVASCVSVFVSNARTAQSVGYGFIIVGFVFQALLSGLYGLLVDVLTNPNNSPAVTLVVSFIKLWPPLQLAKGYYQISFFASKRINYAEGFISSNGGFTAADIWRWHERNSVVAGVAVEPLAHTLGWLAGLVLFYSLLAVYLDAVVPGDQGAARHPLFFLPRAARRALALALGKG